MKDHRVYVVFGLIAALLLAAVSAGAASGVIAPQAAPSSQAEPKTELFADEGLFGQDGQPQAPAASTATLVLSYAAKYVCTVAIPPGVPWHSRATPLVRQETDILIHNPNDFTVDVYIKATHPDGKPTAYKLNPLEKDEALTINCLGIYKMLGMPNNPPPGTDVTGFVVIQVGPQGTGTAARHSVLDVTAEYVRGSEVLKKDIHFQPWWSWWPWGLPWRLGYPYERLIPVITITGPDQVDQMKVNLDCNSQLAGMLIEDVNISGMSPVQKSATIAAINYGFTQYHDAHARSNLGPTAEPALIGLTGGCKKVMMNVGGIDSLYLDVDYVLFSNKSPHEFPGPLGPQGGSSPDATIPPPWVPGFWYDLPVVTAQNYSTDINLFFHDWYSQRWLEAGLDLPTVTYSMQYFFPYWCGWGYWGWWWNAGGCGDIGVGEGESLDVEQITPVRVIMGTWPPPIMLP